jgi:hypothetical protein
VKELLSELEREAAHLSTKSLGPIGFDYRRRTKLERMLFLIAKQYCKDKFNYNLGGLSYTHQKEFTEYTTNNSCSCADVQVMKEAFKISELICDLSSSDPYARENAMEELGGSVYKIFKNLSDRILKFISEVKNTGST